MYYRGVNRGAFLTSPGRYTIALVFTLGLLAVGSGYNGIYLSFSLGVSIIIISGLLSEKVMRHFHIKSAGEVRAEAGTPFVLHFEAENDSAERVLYGIENIFLDRWPDIGRLSMKFDALARANVISIEPTESKRVAAHFSGLPRGKYRKFHVLHRTPYPFGLLTKFKFSELETEVSIFPVFDEKFAREIKNQIHQRMLGNDKDRQFHSHRPFSTKDGVQTVDWKKSAGKPEAKWVVKVYESVKEDFALILRPDWAALRSASTAAAYEKYLSRLRTACQVIQEMGMQLIIELPASENRFFHGDENRILDLWVGLPKFESRKNMAFPDGRDLPAGSYFQVALSEQSFAWVSAYEKF